MKRSNADRHIALIVLLIVFLIGFTVGKCWACDSYSDCMKTNGYANPHLKSFKPESCFERVGNDCKNGGPDCGYIEVPCPNRVQRAIAYKLDEISKKLDKTKGAINETSL